MPRESGGNAMMIEHTSWTYLSYLYNGRGIIALKV